MNKIERSFQSRLQSRTRDTVRLIVRYKGDGSRATARLAEMGVSPLRSFQLIKAVSVSVSAETALALLKEPWVLKIEEDRQVSIQ